MKKYIISAILLALVIVPVLSYGATDNSALIAQLRAQILLLQKQLLAVTQPIQTCPFNKDLTYGQGINDGLSSQVVLIQNALRASGHLNISKSTGYFGTMTRSALRNWQRDNNIQTTGSVRSLERSILCGRNDNGLNTIVINSVSGPTSIGVNQTGTWELKVAAPSDTNLNYTVDWGDSRIYPQISGSSVSPTVKQTSTFTHAYSQAGTYTVRFMVDNGAVCIMAPCTVRKTAETSMTVVVGNPPHDQTYSISPTILPNGVNGLNYSVKLTSTIPSVTNVSPLFWTITTGRLPSGLNLRNSDLELSGMSSSTSTGFTTLPGGEIYGTSSESGSFNFTVKAASNDGKYATRDYSLLIGNITY